MGDENAFEITETDEGSVMSGQRLSDVLQKIAGAKINTFVGVCEGAGNHGNSTVVVEISGLWEPQLGARVQLCEPSRDAVVCSVHYRFGISGDLDVYVFLDDPETTLPDAESQPRKMRYRGSA